MKGNRRQPAVATQPTTPASPTPPKGTSKYANRDGSKIISVPKLASPVGSFPASPVTASMTSNAATKVPSASTAPPTTLNASGTEAPAPTVNRKKAKRRAKAAAKAAAEAGVNGLNAASVPSSPTTSTNQAPQPPVSDAGPKEDELESSHEPALANGHTSAAPSKSGKKGRKQKKDDPQKPTVAPGAPKRAPSPASRRSPARGSGISKEKIWNTSSQEERQRIKEFWLGLGEDERKSLVKVEKDAVLKKMKEQQKQTCSCTVCGRKRTAIEEELEGLYDAYYEELESFANQPNHNGEVPPMLGPSGHFGSAGYSSQVMPSKYPPRQPSRGRIVEHVGDDEEEDDDEDGDDGYSEEELDDDQDYSDDEETEEMHREQPTEHQTDFFNFGNSLTVQGTRFHESLNSLPPYAKSYMEQVLKYVFRRDVDHSLGGILTVADDLLKNDGKKFIEMMEQLAERRMQREEDAKEQFARSYHLNGNNSYPAHNHPVHPEDEEEYEDEEDDEEDDEEEEYDSQDEEFDEEEDAMTEEQRMEEGRRMFQIFAARMFEQRVLTAYREKVAKERQEKLLEELAQEDRESEQRKAKKQKEAQKRKDKQLQKKQAQAEEKARKEAEKAAEEAERLAEEQRKQEEQRQRNEERKKKREAQKKAEEEERLRKEAEKQRRLQEQKERQAEQDRKAREAKEREKKAKEEAKQRDKAARELREREARERREKAEQARIEKEAKTKADKELREAQRKAERAAQKAAALATTALPSPPPPPPPPPPASAAAPGPAPITTNAPAPAHTPAPLAAAAAATTATAAAALPTGVHSAPAATLTKRPAQASNPIPAIPQNPQTTATATNFTTPMMMASPQPPVAATPALPKVPTATKVRRASSHQDSFSGAGLTAHSNGGSGSGSGSGTGSIPTPPNAATPIHTSPVPIGLLSKGGSSQGYPSHSHTTSPLGSSLPNSSHMPSFGMPLHAPSHQHFPPGMGPLNAPPGLASRGFGDLGGGGGGDSMYPPPPMGFRTPGQHPAVPPGLGIPPPIGRGFGHVSQPPPGLPVQPSDFGFGSLSKEPSPLHPHSRQASASFDSPVAAATTPIARPAPIGRPGSVVQGQRGSPGGGGGQAQSEDSNATHLGSSALIDESDEPLLDEHPSDFRSPRRSLPGPPPASRFPPPGVPFGLGHNSPFASSLWSQSPSSVGVGQGFGGPFGSAPPSGFGNMSAGLNPMNPWAAPSRTATSGLSAGQNLPKMRILLKQACQDLAGTKAYVMEDSMDDPESHFVPIGAIKNRVDTLSVPGKESYTVDDLLSLITTEGNASNGGGSFSTRSGPNGELSVRWSPLGSGMSRGLGRSVGEIGSPIVGYRS